ncbi:molybdopterin-dependent oxidoreductase [Halovivax limisalsi]|uniref:molybdopterin-dependent oxidoreductase n=1 Tax=Halovivax limisalsi TaxID=1453760 RepID=UPI001FFD67E9|nr:molybdopterin-dependent oxidoreductase [Halovivax limisalsi]
MGRTNRVRVLFATTAAVAGLAAGYAVAGWTEGFVVLAIDALIVDLTPARVVNYMIEAVGESSHGFHLLGAVAASGTLYASAAAIGLVIARGSRSTAPGVGIGIALVVGPTLVLTGVVLPSIASGLAVGAIVTVGALDRPDGGSTPDGTRRSVVGAMAGTTAVSGLSLLLGSRRTRRSRRIDESFVDDGRTADLLAAADETGIESTAVAPPVSSIDAFYTVDITTAPPTVDATDWRLSIRGAVDRPRTLSFDGIRERERVDRFVALRCIGEGLNDDKLDTALWSGIPLDALLDEVGPFGEYVELHAADGYVATTELDAVRDGLLVYGMNGEILPREHGHPLRLVAPGTWGKLNTKWLTDVVVREAPSEGYWEERGWNSEAPITAVAKLWTIDRLDDGRIEVGGHAYAGTRGVDRVEVSTDGGATWTDADLADPLPGEDVTRQWRYRYEPEGTHEVVVRTIDGNGDRQPAEATDSFPNGPAGWVERRVEP